MCICGGLLAQYIEKKVILLIPMEPVFQDCKSSLKVAAITDDVIVMLLVPLARMLSRYVVLLMLHVSVRPCVHSVFTESGEW